MARSPLMRVVQRIAREALAARGDPGERRAADPARRRLLARAGALAAAGAAGAWSPLVPGAATSRVVIVGAGLAGLAAAHALARAGVHAAVYEGSTRIGGRCWSERQAFADGQVAERGGELIDTSHATLRALVPELGLELDDLLATEPAGSEPVAWFDGAPYGVADITRDFVRVLPAVERDAALLGDELPTFDRHTPAQRRLDRLSAAQWIDANVPGGMRSRFGQLLVNAYGEELGGEPGEISAVTMVSLLAGSPKDRFSPYEESDQRYHVRGGNDQVVTRLAQPVASSIETGARLVAFARGADGRYRLVFLRDGAEREVVADRVILALPFTLLRLADTRNAGFSARKRQSIAELGMGRNTKTQLQFDERFWLAANCNGEYRLRGVFQTTWEVTRAQQGRAGVLNFFAGGAAAEAAGLPPITDAARICLAAMAPMAPQSAAMWNGRVIRNAWDRNPWSFGSYALVKPGQYTSFYGIEGRPEGHVYFAGEHTSLAAQGYLEGAVESGQRAAHEVLASLGMRRLRVAVEERVRRVG
ncbi:MAG: NAD(P)/FAD-dependent oxidoreductase [Burkholderiales bacterium]